MDTDLIDFQTSAGLLNPPTPTTINYRLAVQGEGDLASTWSDKPHRLVFGLCRELEAIAARPLESVNADLLEALKALRLQALQSPDLLATEWGQEALALASSAISRANQENGK